MTSPNSDPPSSARRNSALPADKIRQIYDRIGRWQDTQAFYEDAAIDNMIVHGDFENARQVIEIGCGTGRLAHRLLDNHLPYDAKYLAIELSPRMATIARHRLESYSPRSVVEIANAITQWPQFATRADRVIATYLFDLLDNHDTAALINRVGQVLGPDGLLCTVSLTRGSRGAALAVSNIWTSIWRYRPTMVGGCRPIGLSTLLKQKGWRIEHAAEMVAWGLTSEVVLAKPPRA